MILVDTHVVVWLALDQSQLSKNARAAIDDARGSGDGLAISDITLLELATLSSKGRIRLDISLESFLREIEERFTVLPISGRACVRALALPAAYPKDPADRIIGATALVERTVPADCGPGDTAAANPPNDLVRQFRTSFAGWRCS